MILKAFNLSKRFKKPVPIEIFSNVSLSLEAGECVAITGKSGEGKSTLLHILGTLEPPSSGEVIICGQKTEDLPRLRNKHIGFIFQSSNLLEDYTALDNVLMPAKIGRLPLDKARAIQLLEEVGLASRIHFSAKLLSGGEKQRVAIARALMNDPDLILADEPSGNLDHAHSTAIHELLIGSAKKRGKAVIIVTHDKELAALCDKTYLLMDGRLT